MNNKQVMVTGFSALTASGETADAGWQSILRGQTGLAPIETWDLSSWPTPLGGELKAFQPAKMLPDRKLLKVISRQDVMGIHAAIKAIEHSQCISYRDSLEDATLFNERTGVFVGSPGNKYFQQYDFLPLMAEACDMKAFAESLFSHVHPMWLLRILPNNVLAYTGITYGFKGANHNITNHAVGGAQALLEAKAAIESGEIDRAIVVAYDMGIEPQSLFYYDKLGVISKNHLRPFDEVHDGTVLAEGAAALMLESEDSAKARSARCFARLLGGFSGNEGAGLFSLDASGQALADVIQTTLTKLSLTPQDISLVVAHGNGNKKSDISEALAYQKVFNDYAVPVTAFKWSTGHTLCAAGIVDAVFSLYALNQQCVPGIANIETLSEACAPLNVAKETRPLDAKDSHHILMINRGFGSLDACIVMQSCE